MYPLHPYLSEQLALAHRQDLLRAAAAHNAVRAAHSPPPARASPWRPRIGWVLVEIGLRLAVDHETPAQPADSCTTC